MKTLHLTVTRHWFDKIASGEKKEDFRVIKDYWINRLVDFGESLDVHGKERLNEIVKHDEWRICPSIPNCDFCLGNHNGTPRECDSVGLFKHFDLVKITAGYGKDKPTLTARCAGIRITAYDEQTDLGVGRFFAIGVGDIIEKINVNDQHPIIKNKSN